MGPATLGLLADLARSAASQRVTWSRGRRRAATLEAAILGALRGGNDGCPRDGDPGAGGPQALVQAPLRAGPVRDRAGRPARLLLPGAGRADEAARRRL